LCQYFDFKLVIVESSCMLLPEVLMPFAFGSVCFAFTSLKMLLGFKPKLRHYHIGRWLKLLKSRVCHFVELTIKLLELEFLQFIVG